jgi:hypothetical protein
MYTFQATHGHTEQLSQLLQLSVEEYMNETKLALSTQGGAIHFTYLVEDGSFVWKKLDQCSKIRMKYGYIQLQEVRASMHIVAINGVWGEGAFDFTVFK